MSLLRKAFLSSGFTVEGVAALLGDVAYAAMSRGEDVPVRRALRDHAGGSAGAGAALVRLFLLGDVLPRVELDRGGVPVDDAVALGLVEASGSAPDDRVRALLDVRPYGEPGMDWFVVSDRTDGPLAPDHVLGVGGASTTLARITPRLPVGRALDVGTGCGVQALHLSRHSAGVVVTDTNPRALRLAELSAGLSGVSWEARRGDLLQPVVGERFDLVVSNPPFVVSPRARYEYRDAGLVGDALAPALIAALPAHLADGGTACLLANWLHVRGEDWRERVAGWVEGTGCDAWVVQREVQDPAEYASLWLRDAGEDRGPSYAAAYDAWLDGLEELRAEAVGFGWVVLRRGSEGAPEVTVEDLAAASRLPDGAEVATRLDRLRHAAALLLPALLTARVTWREGTVRTAASVAVAGGTVALPVQVAAAGGWLPPVALPSPVLAALDAASAAPLGAAVDAVARAEGLDPLDLLGAVLPLARQLAADGLLDVEVP